MIAFGGFHALLAGSIRDGILLEFWGRKEDATNSAYTGTSFLLLLRWPLRPQEACRLLG